jgi:hypothetical protein
MVGEEPAALEEFDRYFALTGPGFSPGLKLSRTFREVSLPTGC